MLAWTRSFVSWARYASRNAPAPACSLAVGGRPHSCTADRAEFLGRHGSPAAPAGLSRVGLSGRFGPTLDPCAAIMTEITLAPGRSEEVVFVLGQVDRLEEVRRVVRSYTAPGQPAQALAAVRALWDRILNTIQVRTPDPAIDVLVNRWLLYQVLVCRVWARSAFFQSGGAYGFRDQLQDVMALVYGAPAEARAQILRSAARHHRRSSRCNNSTTASSAACSRSN